MLLPVSESSFMNLLRCCFLMIRFANWYMSRKYSSAFSFMFMPLSFLVLRQLCLIGVQRYDLFARLPNIGLFFC